MSSPHFKHIKHTGSKIFLSRLFSLGLVAALLAMAAFSVQPGSKVSAAVQAICTSVPAGGLWSAAGTWSCGSVPAASDDAVIDSLVQLESTQTIHNLSITSNGTLWADSTPVTLTLTGNLDVQFGGEFNPGYDAGNLGQYPGFATVVLAGTNQQIDTHGAEIDFFNLTKSTTANDTLTIVPTDDTNNPGSVANLHVINNLTLGGNATGPAYLTLVSSLVGTKWQIQPDGTSLGTLNVDYVKVQDSDNVSTINTPIHVEHGQSLGGNTGWEFADPTQATVTVVGNPNPGNEGQTVIFTASISPYDATGEVTFNDSVTSLPIPGCTLTQVTPGTGPSLATATCSTSTLTAGSHTITANYLNGNYTSSSGSVVQVVVIPTAIMLGTSGSPSSDGQSVTLTAMITPVTATGSVEFTVLSATSGGATGPISGCTAVALTTAPSGTAKQAVCTTSFSAAHTYTIQAHFTGTGAYEDSNSNTMDQQVLFTSTTAVVSSLNPSMVGKSVTFTATVTKGGGADPIGTVNFFADGVAISGCSKTLSAGQAACVTSSLAVGSHNITAIYEGDASHLGSSSNTLAQVVKNFTVYLPIVTRH